MKRLILLVIVGLSALSVGSARSLAAESSGTGGFAATLADKNEVPAVVSGLTGAASFHLVDSDQALAYTLTLHDASQLLVAHIHMAPAGQNGAVVAFLLGALPPPGLTQDTVRVQGYITNANLIGPLAGKTIADLVAAMKAGTAYVNAHTVDHPGGATRGQIAVQVDEGGDG
jgi:hypothetical protein